MDISLVDLGAVAFVLAPLVVLVVCLFADPTDLELHAPARVLDWPRGVQEEEPTPWRFEALSSPARRAAIASSEPNRRSDGDDRVSGRFGSKPVA